MRTRHSASILTLSVILSSCINLTALTGGTPEPQGRTVYEAARSLTSVPRSKASIASAASRCIDGVT